MAAAMVVSPRISPRIRRTWFVVMTIEVFRKRWDTTWNNAEAAHLDVDALAFDVTEHLTEMAIAQARTDRATTQAQRCWRQSYGDDGLLLSVPGMGPVTACAVRGFLADGRRSRRRRQPPATSG